MKKKKKHREINLNLVPMIDVTSFILLSLGILVMSMKKEASLDNVLKLPPVISAAKQDTAQLQIYILQASLQPGGYINPDSTGLIAFAGKGSVPEKCPRCGQAFRDAQMNYIPGSLLDITGKTPVTSLGTTGKQTEVDASKASNEKPAAYVCSRCKAEISPYRKLQEIPQLLKEEKQKVIDMFLAGEKQTYLKNNGVEMSPAMVKVREDSLKHSIPLMIKADNEAFYGRILQVINMAKDTLCDIRKFAFVSSSEAVEKAQKAAREAAGK